MTSKDRFAPLLRLPSLVFRCRSRVTFGNRLTKTCQRKTRSSLSPLASLPTQSSDFPLWLPNSLPHPVLISDSAPPDSVPADSYSVTAFPSLQFASYINWPLDTPSVLGFSPPNHSFGVSRSFRRHCGVSSAKFFLRMKPFWDLYLSWASVSKFGK